eukprot:scaffold1900_cov389-Prasinococcus_capsulatus_cf.AAC.6
MFLTDTARVLQEASGTETLQAASTLGNYVTQLLDGLANQTISISESQQQTLQDAAFNVWNFCVAKSNLATVAGKTDDTLHKVHLQLRHFAADMLQVAALPTSAKATLPIQILEQAIGMYLRTAEKYMDTEQYDLAEVGDQTYDDMSAPTLWVAFPVTVSPVCRNAWQLPQPLPNLT